MKHFRPIDRDEVGDCLSRILQSRTFARSERLRAFLKFIVETEQLGHARKLKAYTIGLDVFGRDGAFESGGDPLVRVQAGKLRRLLGRYYADEGRDDPIHIRIPLGAYIPVYERQGVDIPAFETGPCDLLPPPSSQYVSPAGQQSGPPDRHSQAALPSLLVTLSAKPERQACIYANALVLAAEPLPGIRLVSSGSCDMRDALAFAVLIETRETSLSVSLRHQSTGEVLDIRTIATTSLDTTDQLAGQANQFVARTMTLPGLIYRYCRSKGLTTLLMDGLQATYDYRLDGSEASYQRARFSQLRLAHPKTPAEIVTSLAGVRDLAR